MTIALIVLSAIVSIFTLMAIGGNDVANSQGTAVGSGALSLRGAQIIAGLCEFAGAALVGHHVSNTIGSDLVDRDSTDITDQQFCWGMFSGLLSVGIWMILATKIKMPVSATHSIIGALFGLNLVMTNFNFSTISWDILGKIAIAWIVTPLLSFGASYLSLLLLNHFWPDSEDRDKDEYASHSLIEPSGTGTQTSLLSFVMAPPKLSMQPVPSPSPRRLGDERKLRLDDSLQKTKRENIEEVVIDTKEDKDDEDEYFKPAKFKFGLIFGILMATLCVFLMVGGPKSINIEDGAFSVDSWVIVVISFGTLILFTVIGVLIEPLYRKLYVKCVYSIQSQKKQQEKNKKNKQTNTNKTKKKKKKNKKKK
eukprot:275204_1